MAPPLYGVHAPYLATSAAPGPRDHDEAVPHLAAEEEREGADCLISACASHRATTDAPVPRDHDEASPRCRVHLAADEERAGATLRQRRASQDAAAAPSYRGGTPRQHRAGAPSRPTSPASPRRPRRRRGTTARRGCGAARTSPPTGSSSLHKPTGSPLPGGEDGMRDNCCVRRQLYGDACHRCVRAAAAGCIGFGVRDLAGAPLQRRSSAEPDSSTSNGEDIPRGNDSEDRPGRSLTFDDSSIVVLIEASDEVGTVVREGVKDLVGASLQRTGEASSSSGLDSSVIVLIGKPADGGTLVGGGVSGAAEKAAADIFLADPDRNHFMARFTRAIEMGPVYWAQELIDWLKGPPTNRFREYWSWRGVVGVPIKQDDGTCAICATLVCLEARHRLDFERRHGFKTFPYRIPAETVTALKNLCEERGIWTARYGADGLRVLKVIQEAGGSASSGVPGWKPCSLQVKSWKYHSNSLRQPIPHVTLARLIRSEGPLLGRIMVADSYDDLGLEDGVYRGVPEGYKGTREFHLVVCVGYYHELRPAAVQRNQRRLWHRYGQTETELYIQVVDNHTEDGPVRWILARAFTRFIEVHVEPLDATELRVKKPSLWHRLLDTVSPRHRL